MYVRTCIKLSIFIRTSFDSAAAITIKLTISTTKLINQALIKKLINYHVLELISNKAGVSHS